ncbi:MAG: type II secretion system minor pseudopilin GspH, partial [Legionellaceae bacterium]
KEPMLKLETGMPAKKTCLSQGFTLIEILVVLTILGITLGFALVSFGDFGAGRRMTSDVEHIKQVFELVQEQAILESTPYAINIKKTGYAVLRFSPPSQWEAIPTNPWFKGKLFSNGLVAHLESSTKIKSMIIIHPSGTISPFRLTFESTKTSKKLTLIGQDNGKITMEQSP